MQQATGTHIHKKATKTGRRKKKKPAQEEDGEEEEGCWNQSPASGNTESASREERKQARSVYRFKKQAGKHKSEPG